MLQFDIQEVNCPAVLLASLAVRHFLPKSPHGHLFSLCKTSTPLKPFLGFWTVLIYFCVLTVRGVLVPVGSEVGARIYDTMLPEAEVA